MLVALAGCWTSSAPVERVTPPANTAPPEARPMRFRVELERTACMGRCPIYKVTIHGSGRVEWDGVENVLAIGHVDRPQLARRDLEKLARQIDDAKFFDRNEYGQLETGPVCTTTGNTTTCSYSAHFCSDTTHAKITVTRNGRTHTIDNDHCDEKPGIDELEQAIDELARTGELVGR
ncbi:MAG TPA: DUF6438 domain-containing protein [Kofleriaceae bacterium]|nr:DUF6438 domain-containing protein [Kofleriaceae bacterium]